MLECISKLSVVAVYFQTVFKSVRILKSVLSLAFSFNQSSKKKKKRKFTAVKKHLREDWI